MLDPERMICARQQLQAKQRHPDAESALGVIRESRNLLRSVIIPRCG
jgi:hypothetical protein